MTSLGLFVLAAICEIAGCFAFWAVFRSGATKIWLIPGILSLIAFAWILTRVDADFAGRPYAAYGGIYISASLVWLWAVEGQWPDRWDVMGGVVCLAGAAIILLGPRAV